MYVQPLRIAVTGTPGTGKTSFCSKLGFKTMSVLDLAIENDTIANVNNSSETVEIDIELLNQKLSEKWKHPPEDTVLIDGHLSHYLPVDRIIVLRCSPDILEKRLIERKWTLEKIQENKEFEFLSAIINELDENIITLELNNSTNSIEHLRNEFILWLNHDKESLMLNLDWMSELNP